MLKQKEKRIPKDLEKMEEEVRENTKYRKSIVKFYLIHILLGFFLITDILIPFFLYWGKLSFLELMYLQAYFMIMIIVFEVPCGAIADHISRKCSLFLGSLAGGFAFYIYGLRPDIFVFVIGETLCALSEALVSGSNHAIIYDTLKGYEKEDQVPKVIARSNSFYLGGILISAPIGSFLSILISLSSIV